MRKILIVEYERPVSELIRMNLAGAAGAYAQTVLICFTNALFVRRHSIMVQTDER